MNDIKFTINYHIPQIEVQVMRSENPNQPDKRIVKYRNKNSNSSDIKMIESDLPDTITTHAKENFKRQRDLSSYESGPAFKKQKLMSEKKLNDFVTRVCLEGDDDSIVKVANYLTQKKRAINGQTLTLLTCRLIKLSGLKMKTGLYNFFDCNVNQEIVKQICEECDRIKIQKCMAYIKDGEVNTVLDYLKDKFNIDPIFAKNGSHHSMPPENFFLHLQETNVMECLFSAKRRDLHAAYNHLNFMFLIDPSQNKTKTAELHHQIDQIHLNNCMKSIEQGNADEIKELIEHLFEKKNTSAVHFFSNIENRSAMLAEHYAMQDQPQKLKIHLDFLSIIDRTPDGLKSANFAEHINKIHTIMEITKI